MNNLPKCTKCDSPYTYEDGSMYVCPECGNEWSISSLGADSDPIKQIKDSNGNALFDGDTITVIKNLKVKGIPSGIKAGTKIKNIRLVDGDHDIDCKIPGIGPMMLKSQFVKKA